VEKKTKTNGVTNTRIKRASYIRCAKEERGQDGVG
jgi:hypothetical protein